MEGLTKLIQQQHEFEAYKSQKAQQLADHVDHLKYLIKRWIRKFEQHL